jgi:hypothetical protein
MVPRIVGGRVGTPLEHGVALAMQQGVQRELETVRLASASWGKGVAAAVAGVVGFSLIKGRSDVSELTPAAGIAVGALLLGTLIVGCTSVYLLMRAAYGGLSPVSVSTGRGLDGVHRVADTDHAEATRSTRALRSGLATAGFALLLLMAAIAATWYGPTKVPARVTIGDQRGEVACGDVDGVVNGHIVLDTDRGKVSIPLDHVNSVAAVPKCGTPVGP